MRRCCSGLSRVSTPQAGERGGSEFILSCAEGVDSLSRVYTWGGSTPAGLAPRVWGVPYFKRHKDRG